MAVIAMLAAGASAVMSGSSATAAALPTLSVSDQQLTEPTPPNTATMPFTVSLSGASSSTVTVHYFTRDGVASDPQAPVATSPSDYTATSGTLTFNPGDTALTVPVTIPGEQIKEPTESFELVIDSPTNATVAKSAGRGDVIDSNGPPPAPTLTINDVSHDEGTAGVTPFTFTISLNPVSQGPVTVDYATADGTAKAPADYTATSGTLTFTAGQSTQTITVNVPGDIAGESDQAFAVNLARPTGAQIGRSQGIGTITNGHRTSFAIDDVSAEEGNSGTTQFTFTVTRSGDLGKVSSVDFTTQDGSAHAPGDYAAKTGTLLFQAGDATMQITVLVVADTTPEPDKTFFVRLSNATNATGITRATGTGTILADDFGSGATPTLTVAPLVLNEGEGTANVSVSLSPPSAQTVTASFATQDQTATAGTDYSAVSGQVSFAPGSRTQVINVPILDDNVSEGNQTFILALSNPNGAVLGGNGSGQITIVDDQSTGGGGGGGNAGTFDLITTGAGAGGGPDVRTFNSDASPAANFFAFDPSFAGGVSVARGDVDPNSPGKEIVVGAGPGALPVVRVYTNAGKLISEFLAYDPNFRGGVNVAVGNVVSNPAGGVDAAEIITGAGPGGGPHVRVFTGSGTPIGAGFFAYEPGFRGGVTVAAGPVDGTPGDKIVTGPGAGGGPLVKVFTASGDIVNQGFYAYDAAFAGGVSVAVGNIDNSGPADIVTGAGPGGGPDVRSFTGSGIALYGFLAYDPNFHGGVSVAVGDLDGAAPDEIVTGAGPGGGPHVRAFRVNGAPLGPGFFPYDVNFHGGVKVAMSPA